jgi:selenocysteine lyase/cysteine desulfurase
LSATGRKYLRAPRGTGFLYVSKEVLNQIEPVFLDLHAAAWVNPDNYSLREDARRFENWESNCAGKAGLYSAVAYALQWGLENIQARVTTLADNLRQQLQEVPLVTVQDIGKDKSGIVTFTMQGKDLPALKAFLRERKINVSVTTRTSTLLDMDNRNLKEMVRASVHYYNSEEEIGYFCQVLRGIR